ncbi:hypothetical protein PG985_007790 [Apiospora marii]|uniref:uncharacterized protein n=1 Tax=Apiospora marii TaxID=335849 RepID=UPI00312CF2EF
MAGLAHLVMLPLALMCWAAQVGATTFPATVEVDLIFPQNETYAPTEVFPFVFACKSKANPEIVLSTLDLSDTIFNASDITFVYGYKLNFTSGLGVGPWHVRMTWETMAGNCSDHGLAFGGGYVQPGGVEFTIQKGGRQPDLVAATSDKESCKNIPHAGFNITGTQFRRPQPTRPHDSCAVFSDVQPRPEGDPCKVQVSPSAASSIVAAIRSSECAVPRPVIGGCNSISWRVCSHQSGLMSTFEDQTSDAPPSIVDCMAMVNNIRGTQGKWEVENAIGTQHEIAHSPNFECKFGV